MRRADQLVASTLRLLRDAVQPGITTAELDRIAERTSETMAVCPRSRSYHGFPRECVHLGE